MPLQRAVPVDLTIRREGHAVSGTKLISPEALRALVTHGWYDR